MFGLGLLIAAQAVLRVRLAPSSSFELFVEEMGTLRPIEPRLTGGFKWGMFSSGTAHQEHRPSLELHRAILWLERTAAEQPSPENLGRVASAWLLVGKTEKSVKLLERAVKFSTKNGRLRSDLAAALLVRDRASDANAALTWSERAIALEPTLKEAWFNRALALERLSLTSQARKAWHDYRSSDIDSQWSNEASGRLQMLSVQSWSEAWEIVRLKLLNVDAELDVVQAVRLFPQECRELIEEELLSAWGEKFLLGDKIEADKIIFRAQVIAVQLKAQGNDELPLSMLAPLYSEAPTRLRLLAQGHLAYAKAKPLYDRLDYGNAAPLFKASQESLKLAGSDFAAWAALHLSIMDYQRREIDRAAADLQKILMLARARGYLTLEGRAEWILSLIDNSRGNFASTLLRLDRARLCFQHAREAENTAAVETIIAEQTRFMGESSKSWEYLRRSLNALPRVRRLSRKQATLLTATHTSLREYMPEAAIHYQDAFVEAAHASGAAIAEAEGYLHRAKVYQALENVRAARNDLARASRLLRQAGEHPLREFVEPQILLAEASMIEADQLSKASEKIANALKMLEKGQRSNLIPAAYLGLARVNLRRGDLAGAERALADGLAIFEHQQKSLRGSPLRLSFFDESWELFEEMLSLQVDLGRPDAAFLVAERGRSRVLAEQCGNAKPVVSTADIMSRLPESSVFVEFAVTPSRWFAWIITAQKSHFVSRNTSANQLRDMVSRYRLEIEANRVSDGYEMSARLYDELVRPLKQYMPEKGLLIIVPDSVLHWVPFATLRDSKAGEFLIESHSITIAPSAALALRATGLSKSTALSALVIGNPAISRESHPDVVLLEGAASEAREVAALYKEVELLIEGTATRRRVLDALWGSDVVHFAGHALPNSEYSGLASLLLAPDELTNSDAIFAHELELLGCSKRAVPQLVVLAGCATAVGAGYRGEGLLSLVRPFLAVGVPNLVASYWNLDDQASKEYLVRFHQMYQISRSAAGALRAAQIEAIRSNVPPAHWGAFTVFGVVQTDP